MSQLGNRRATTDKTHTLHSQSGTVTLTDVLGSRNIYSLFDNKRVPENGGVLSTGPLEPGDGRMYVLCTSGVFQRIREAVARNKYMLKRNGYLISTIGNNATTAWT